MSDLSKLQGTSWHVGYIKKAENDPRRHRSRCTHYRTDNSCSLNSHCIGSSHCSDYEDAILKKQKEEYRAHKKTWVELSPSYYSPTIIQLDDFVVLYSFSDNTYHELDFHKPYYELPDLFHAVLGRKVGSIIEFRNELYCIEGKFKSSEELNRKLKNIIRMRTNSRCAHADSKGFCKIKNALKPCSIEDKSSCPSFRRRYKQKNMTK